MWFFKSNKTLIDSGFFRGFTDWHSHILPGVDDGVKTVEESIRILSVYERMGVREVWLTPHVMEDCPNTTSDLRFHFENLKSIWKGGVKLKLASENMLDSLFEERLAQNDFLPIGEKGNYLLVETSYFTPPIGMDEMLEGVFSAGYFPLLAHPERYRYMEECDYQRYKKRGIHFQINLVSLTGGYGEVARKKAEWLLKKGMVDVIGSDLHRLEVLDGLQAKSRVKNNIIGLLTDKSIGFLS